MSHENSVHNASKAGDADTDELHIFGCNRCVPLVDIMAASGASLRSGLCATSSAGTPPELGFPPHRKEIHDEGISC